MCFHQRPNAVGRYLCAVRLRVNPTMDILSQLNKLCDQDAYLELKPKSKIPVANDWPNKGQAADIALSSGKNIGLILGATSGLLDVDLDCREAKSLADIILPVPMAAFDRGTANSGHYLYKAITTGPRKSFASADKSTLVELRGDGSQTMIPPSVHPNDIRLEFTSFDEEASTIAYEVLLKAVNLLAACSELAQNWREGCRHELALSFSGFARKHGLELNFIMQIVQGICQIANDADVEDRLNAVRSTFARPLEAVIGSSGLSDCLGETVAKRIADRFACHSGKANKVPDLAITQPNINDVVNYGQFSDKANVTEAKMGSTFAKWLDGKAVYVFEKKQWMIWNGSYWEADQRSLITRLAYHFVTETKAALVDIGKYSDLSNLSQFESINKLENIAKFATTDRSVSASEFDTDPFLLSASDVWVDLISGKAVAPDPSKLVSKALSVNYDQTADCPNFMKFLDDIFERDQELIGFVQRAIGYSLTGSTSEQCLFIMIGDGANGKSTFINVINKLLGLYGSTAASQTLIANGGNSIGDDLVDLIGARLITVSETEEGQSLAEAKIKQMTGGDRLKGRPLYGTHIQFNIIGKLWLATNSLPQINNTDHGIWRRIKAIPFNRTFSAEEQDKTLGDKLLQELPGILNWAIEGCLTWQADELQTPQVVEDQVAEYKSAMDSISQFVTDECEQDSNHICAASKFYQAYRDWCCSAGRKPQSQTAFKRALEKLNGVYQQRSSSGLQWHGIQPCLTY